MMGYRYAKACTFANTPPLTDRARLVLVRMAWPVLDKQAGEHQAGEYYGGWEYLALPWDDGTRTRASLKVLVARALAELVSKGYVKPLGASHLGQRQHYQITIDW